MALHQAARIAPLAITGPVGWPVGEPPTGSSETASAAVGPRRSRRDLSRWKRFGSPGGKTPTEIGAPPAGISHSSVLRLLATAAGLAGTTSSSERSMSMVAVQPATPLSPAMVETKSTEGCVAAVGATGRVMVT